MSPMTPIIGFPSSALASPSRPLVGVLTAAGLAAVTACSSVGTGSEPQPRRSITAEEHPVLDAEQPAAPADQPISEAPIDPQILTASLFEHADVDLSSKGMVITSDDGDTTFRVGGRIQVDVTGHSEDQVAGAEITDGTELRRGRFYISGKQRDGWLWSSEVEFGGDRGSLRDFWLAHEDSDKQRITVGNQKQPFSLSLEMSSNDLPFVERSLDNFLVVAFMDRAIGVRVDSPGENSLFSAGIYGENIAQPNGDDTEDEGFGATARYTYAPILEDDETLHLAVRGAVRTPSSDNSVRIRTESTNQSNFRISDAQIASVEETFLYGFETAYVTGPWSLTTEYNIVDIGRTEEDLTFTSWHVAGTYSLTGESRAQAYRIGAGEFKRLKQATTGINPFNGGGAWELGLRFANLDLTDGPIDAGRSNSASLALNWYANTNVRFQLDWTRILDTDGGTAVTQEADGLDVFTLRAQLLF